MLLEWRRVWIANVRGELNRVGVLAAVEIDLLVVPDKELVDATTALDLCLANIIGDGAFDTGADIIKAKGGKDIVKIASLSLGGVHADGGKGVDELQFTVDLQTTAEGTTILDIENPGANTGAMTGSVFKGFEVFTATSLAGFLHHLDFRGSNADETVTGVTGFFGPPGTAGADLINGRGGDDTLDGKGGNDRLTGGSGKDTLLFTTALGATTNADTVADFQPGVDTLGLNGFIFAAAGGLWWAGGGQVQHTRRPGRQRRHPLRAIDRTPLLRSRRPRRGRAHPDS